MIKLDIKPLMDNQNISRYQLAKQIDVSYPTMDSLYKGKNTSIKFEILEALCRELHCSPNDIFISDIPEVNQYIKGDTE